MKAGFCIAVTAACMTIAKFNAFPAVTLSPASLSFGNVFKNRTSAPKTVLLTNNQSFPLNISSIATSLANFVQTNNCPNALAAGGSCTISVTFTPNAIMNFTGQLTVSDNASTSPQTAALSGTGVKPVVMAPSSINFGNQIIFTSSNPQTVTVTNQQTVPLNFSSIQASGDFRQSNTCGSNIPGASSCTVAAVFNPTAIGTRTGSVVLTDDAGSSPQFISLSGYGLAAGPTPTPRTSAFRHVVVIVQENRTPDNLFQGLCASPFGNADSCSTSPRAGQHNIQTSNWLNKQSSTGVTQPGVTPLAAAYDLDHRHAAFVAMCDKNSSGACKMDGAANIACTGACIANPQFQMVDNSTGILNPYLQLATQYGWANYMFQTNQGPSFPAHLYLFSGTSGPSAGDDAAGIFAAENGAGTSGCISLADVTVALIDPTGENQSMYPCFEHQTIPDLLPRNVTWRYYTAGKGGIWNAPDAIQHICESSGPGGQCRGPQWSNNVDMTPADVLTDVAMCNLPSLSWVTPTGQNSDHAQTNDGGGPSWVASIVNAIGNSTSCDRNTGYWKNTAIFVTWDDWGGWYDHEPPEILGSVQGDYERGFRVPLIVVSAHTPKGYIDNNPLDFGSLLRFIEKNFGIGPGALNFADARTDQGLDGFFSFEMNPRSYTAIRTTLSAEFFLNDKRPATDPDDE